MVKIIVFPETKSSFRDFRSYIYTFLGLILFSFTLSAQIVLKGHIVDQKTHEPIIGVAVVEKSTTNGVNTGIDGTFSLNVKSLPIYLIVKSLGYESKVIQVKNISTPLDIYLSPDDKLLNEVVVVGYGSQRRKELTGSVASVSQSTLNQPAISIDGVLGGAVSGVNVTQVSGQPGGASTIRIRGGNSVWASNEPLYVIDGFIYFNEKNSTQAGVSGIDGSLNPLSSINPADIESIEVLKDVSAKAIYGSRGANGVVIVTTKKGKRGKNVVNYQYSLSVDKSAKKLDLLDAQQWAAISKEYFNNKVGQYYTTEQIAALGKGTDWQSAVLQTAITQRHDVSVSGGDEKTRYLISGNQLNQDGIILNSNYKRYSGRVNLDREVSDNLSVGITVTADKSNQNALTTFDGVNFNDSPYSHGIANSLTYALYMPPVISIYNTDGSYNYTNPFEYSYLRYYTQAANPVSDLKNSIAETLSSSLLGNFYATYKVPYVKGLIFKLNAGTNVNYITQNFFAPPYTALGLNQDTRGIGAIGNRHTNVTQVDYLATYMKRINKAHFIDLLAGYTRQITSTNFVHNKVTHLTTFNLNQSTSESSQRSLPKTYDQSANLQSLLARANYTFQEKYNLTATFRADKSTRFPVGHRWALFPSIGLSWNISDENFAKNLLPNLSTLKLRGTYGTSGNQEIGLNEYSAYFENVTYNNSAAYQLTTLNNPNLKWETTKEYNFGIDAGILNDRISFVADIYYKKTNNLLSKIVPILGSATNDVQTTNLGNLTNKGLEFAVNAKLIEQANFNWSASANIAHNSNKITSIEELTVGDDQEQILRIGKPVGTFYGYIFDGVVQSNEDVSKLPTVGSKTPSPGDAKLRDISGPNGVPDGKISADYDRVTLGSIQPDFTYGFSTSITYHRWDAYLSFFGSHGNKVYNLLRRYLEGRPNDSYNMSAAILNAWTPSNPSNSIPSLTSTRPSELDSRFVEDASFLKLKNITVGYTLPLKLNSTDLKLRFFASARNLLTLTKYKGYDPEVANGIDLGTYPTARTFVFGAGFTF
ncbi:MAG: TonB-dependent receptor [Dysgonamonadaceae bacterium]